MTEEARVVDVLLEAAPDSEGLVVVVLSYPNGARSQLQLNGEATSRLVEALSLDTVRDLVGRPFSAIAKALPANAQAEAPGSGSAAS